MTFHVGWLEAVCLLISSISALGIAYERGKLSQMKWCRQLVAQSHLAQTVEMSQLRAKLKPWLGEGKEYRQ